MIVKSLGLICPFPTVTPNKDLIDGIIMSQPAFCRKRCKDKGCSKFIEEVTQRRISHRICPYGFSVFICSSVGASITINGVLETSLNKECPKERRKANQANKLSLALVEKWVDNVDKLLLELEEAVKHQVSESIAPLHDVKTAAGLCLDASQRLIQNSPGSNFDEKVDNASHDLRTLFHASRLLVDQLRLMDIIANPESITYGHKRSRAIYKLFDSMVRLHREKARKKKLRIRLEGQSYREPRVYDSIELIPLILLDNAIKYSLEENDIIVQIRDEQTVDLEYAVAVSVTSYGPIVDENHREQIFKKFFRGPSASKFASQGSGLGLFIAQQIAKAHGFQICYEAKGPFTMLNGVKCGHNIFSFRVPC